MRKIMKTLCVALLLVAAALPLSGADAASELPQVPVASFSSPTEYQIKPYAISLGASACAPYLKNLRWQSYGRTGARATGTGLFPAKGAMDCAEAAGMAQALPVSVVLSDPADCNGHLVFTRIGWRARGNHSHAVTYCG
jgi:hypothetical protein